MKIVYFDYWTKGLTHFSKLDSKLKAKGHETMLFHIGSFREKCAKEELINGIKCQDISYYNTGLIYKALKQIKPDVIVTLNTTYLFDRVVVLAARALGIKTVFMMHGMRATGDKLEEVIDANSNHYNSIFNKLRKARKYIGTVIPNYFYSSLKYRYQNILNLKFLKVILSYFSNPAESFFYPKYSDELLHDSCLVYAQSYVEYYHKVGYNKQSITVVGDPANDRLFEKIEKDSFSLSDLPADTVNKDMSLKKNYALYLEDCFVEQKLFGWTNEDRNQQLLDIAKRLEKEDLNLVVKLHPGTKIANVTANNSNLIVVQEADFQTLIRYSKFCIAHVSTTALAAIIQEKPLLIPRFGKSKDVFDYFIKDGLANPIDDLDAEFDLTVNGSKRLEYLNYNISVLNSSSVDNIVSSIVN